MFASAFIEARALVLCIACPAQGGGVFCNPKSPSAPAKLRLLYECAPLALIVEVSSRACSCGVLRMDLWALGV
jgi:hypothetical protein